MRLLEFFSPTFKRLAGLLLTGFSAVALFNWVIASLQSDNPWYSASFLWMGTLLTLLLGLIFLVSSLSKVKDVVALMTVRKKLIRAYLYCALGVSVLLVITQYVLSDKRLPSPQAYVPIIILLAIIQVTIVYVKYIRKVRFSYKAFVFVPLLFLIGNVLAPFLVITLFNDLVQKVQILESGEAIIHAESNFLKFKDLKLDVDRTLIWTQNWDGKEWYRTEYDVLIPVVTHPRDTLYNVWIEISFSEKFSGQLPADSLQKLTMSFHEKCHQNAVHFDPDRVTFFDATFKEGEKVLAINQYPIVKGAILLRPQYRNLTVAEAPLITPMTILLLIISAGFWVITRDHSNHRIGDM
jgi:hypothetical protein